jgi:HAD superfamily hydrolase (TIGR01509 family)
MRELPGRYRAVIFDMDGLLLDTETLWQRSESELFRRHGQEFTREDQLAVMGTSFDFSGRYYAERLGKPAAWGLSLVDEMHGYMLAELQREVLARPGAHELVACLRGRVPIGLASNSGRELVDVALATAGLSDAFDTIVTSADVAAPKPAPDIYLLACARLAVAPADALALEDSAPGIAAAKAAGLTCIAVPQFVETDVSAADEVIDSLEELLTAS